MPACRGTATDSHPGRGRTSASDVSGHPPIRKFGTGPCSMPRSDCGRWAASRTRGSSVDATAIVARCRRLRLFPPRLNCRPGFSGANGSCHSRARSCGNHGELWRPAMARPGLQHRPTPVQPSNRRRKALASQAEGVRSHETKRALPASADSLRRSTTKQKGCKLHIKQMPRLIQPPRHPLCQSLRRRLLCALQQWHSELICDIFCCPFIAHVNSVGIPLNRTQMAFYLVRHSRLSESYKVTKEGRLSSL